jgi:hypothetical protein
VGKLSPGARDTVRILVLDVSFYITETSLIRVASEL